MTNLRIFFIGGLISFRALFNWMNPWILVPTMLVQPVCQILLFAYIGRAAGVGSDEFFVIGNALNYAAIPCMFAMAHTIGGERYSQTLGLVLVTPARRVPLFLGRTLPAIVNGWAVAMFGLIVGSLLLDAHIAVGLWPSIALVVVLAAAASTGLGLVLGAIALILRETATLGNVAFLMLLLFTGTNVALDDLPGWMGAIGQALPLTHAIEAARAVATGATLQDVSGLLRREMLVGAAYAILGLSMLGWLENRSRAGATLDRI